MLFMRRKDGERGLIAIEYGVELSVSGLEVYIHGSVKTLIQTTRGDRVNGLEPASVLKKAKNEKRL